MADIKTLSTHLALLRELKSHHERLAELCGSEIAKIGPQVYEALTESDLLTLTIAGDAFQDQRPRIITPELKFKPSVVSDEKLFPWLREHGFGVLIKETVHPKTLEKFVTDQKSSNQALPPEDCLRVFAVQTASVRRAPQPKE